MTNKIKAFIFDLDGVITDTAEYHYLAWKRLADEENIPFDRQENEQFRGISRRDSLKLLLKGRQISTEKEEVLLERKNQYYQDFIKEIDHGDLLPGILDILKTLDKKGYLLAVASASKNARTVINSLGIGDLFAVIADGYSVERTKPAPDLFLYAVEKLGVEPEEAVVVEDAAAGIEAALRAGMTAVGIGPAERVGKADYRYDEVKEIDIAEILSDSKAS